MTVGHSGQLTPQSEFRPDADLTAPPARIHWRRWALGGGTGLVVVATLVWNFTPSQGLTKPVHLQRQPDGSFVSDEGETEAFSAKLAKLNAKNASITGSTASHSSPGWFPSQRLMIVNLSEHLLMQRVGQELLRALKEKSTFDQIDYYPAGHLPAVGELSPDLFLTLDLESITESGLLGRDLKCRLNARLGTSFAASNLSSSSVHSPPLAELHARMIVDHESELSGIESAGARYRLQGANLSEQIVQKIGDFVDEMRQKHGEPPALPATSKLGYEPFPEFQFLSQFGAELQSSVYRLLQPNDTLWLLPEGTDARQVVDRMQSELVEAGWKQHGSTKDESPPTYASFATDAERLELFLVDGDGFSVSGRKPPPQRFQIRYQRLARPDEAHRWFEALVQSGELGLSELLKLRRYGDAEQAKAILQRAIENPPATVTGQLALVDHYQRQGELVQAERALRAAFVYSRLSPMTPEASTIKSKAKELMIDPTSLKEISPGLWKELGVLQMPEDGSPMTVEFEAGELAAVIDLRSEHWIVRGALIDAQGRDQFRVLRFERGHDGSSSTMTSNGVHFNEGVPQLVGTHNGVRMEIERIAPQKFRMTITDRSAVTTKTGSTHAGAIQAASPQPE